MLGDKSDTLPSFTGDQSREAIDSLKGYAYQIYQSAIAWLALKPEEFLFLEVAEDYAVAASNALKAVQVKETAGNVSINSDDIVKSIDSFVDLKLKNPDLQVTLHHLTTSKIVKEKSQKDRIDQIPTLDSWRNLAKTGDLDPLRKILSNSKLSEQTKDYIQNLNGDDFRDEFLKKIHFDCGVLNSKYLLRLLRSKLSILIQKRGGVNSQVDDCLYRLLITLLYKSTQQEIRFVDRNILEKILEEATHIPINIAQFELQTDLVNKVLSSTNTQSTNLISTRFTEPRPIDEVPLPVSIANRITEADKIISSLQLFGISWVFGAAGVGKTTGAKIAANRIGGIWAAINLRGLNSDQVSTVLSDVVISLTDSGVNGLLVDDLECDLVPSVIDKLLYLFVICNRADLLLLFTSPKSANSDFLFNSNLTEEINCKFLEFSESDIGEILNGLGVDGEHWSKYIHLISGGGHPQLAIAAIQNMQKSGWDPKELKTLDSLLVGNSEIEQVRSNTRERLLKELPEDGRRLLERLSLRTGGFKRDFVLEIGLIEPIVNDCGIIFEQLIGSWIDQQALDSFSLSPLLSNFAQNTLTDNQKKEIYFKIASILIKGESLDLNEMNSALLAAWLGKNEYAISKICMVTLFLDNEVFKKISSHLIMFRGMRTDKLAYKENPAISQMYRGIQLLSVCHENEGKKRIHEILECFEAESKLVEKVEIRDSMVLIVYAKLFLSDLDISLLPEFSNLVLKLNEFLENKNDTIPAEVLEQMDVLELNGTPLIGFLFLYQVQKIEYIKDLIDVFDFLNSCDEELRQKLLSPFDREKFTVDLLVTGAWLKEHKLNSIDSDAHSKVFAYLEDTSIKWGRKDIAVSCRKFRVITIDEYSENKDLALNLIDEGLKRYGETNSELIRAKSKVLYRSEDHQNSLELSKKLIESNAPLDNIEKAFLGRETAISAEKQCDYQTARKYFLFASDSANNTDLNDMKPMSAGLLADAALASWHLGDRETCINDLKVVLIKLKDIDPKSSLRAAHCHNMCRHTLLWLDGEATGREIILEGEEEISVYPGINSNPEPHPEIANRYLTPLGIAWYMLAIIENNSYLNLGVNQNLESYLPEGKTIVEGQTLLAPSKIQKALVLLEVNPFIEALEENIALAVYFAKKAERKNNFDLVNVTYGRLPVPSFEQQTNFSSNAEAYIIIFIASCIFANKISKIDLLVNALKESKGFIVRKEFVDCLHNKGVAEDYNTYTALLIINHKLAIEDVRPLPPSNIYDFVFRSLQISKKYGVSSKFTEITYEWLTKKWSFIWGNQRFLLINPNLHIKQISYAFSKKGDSFNKLVELLKAILPTMGFSDELSYRTILEEYSDSEHISK